MSEANAPAATLELHQQLLVEMAQWLARANQYSPDHPTCIELCDKLHRTLTRALEATPLVGFGVLKDTVMLGDVASKHPVLRQRIAPHLHDRGVLVLRFMQGLKVSDLRGFLDLVRLPQSAIFDQGGLARLVLERGIVGVQVEEIAHDITAEQLESSRRRQRLGTLLAEVLRSLRARRDFDAAIGAHLLELLEYPEIAVAVLEDQGAGIADAAAGVALLVRQEELATGRELSPKLRGIFIALSPPSRDRLLLGFPHLVEEFRDALAWAMRGYQEAELARFTLPSFRSHAAQLDVVLYALGALLPHDGTRLSMLRLTGLRLHDLTVEDPVAPEVLTALARPVEDFETYRRERQCLVVPAAHALEARTLLPARDGAGAGSEPERALAPFDERAAIAEVVAMASNTRQFEKLCRRLPAVAARLASDGRRQALMGAVSALSEVQRPEARGLANSAATTLARASAPELLAELERTLGVPDGVSRDLAADLVRLLVGCTPHAVLDHLEHAQNAALRDMLLDALPVAGPGLLPVLRSKLGAHVGASALALVALVPMLGGTAADLAQVSRSRAPQVRHEVARLLRTMPQDEQAMAIVVRYLSDPVVELRQGVKMLLRGDQFTPAVIEAVAALLADPHQLGDDLHRRLLRALGASRHDGAAHLLVAQLQPHGLIESKATGELRELAALALRRCPAPAAQRLFREALVSPVGRVRKACERAASEPA
ncbi:MAG: hypothetical protein IT370_10730 [Deltaproteobacteria bacterium]|nr:hypothetical protein [Deltaproteobacteria bacterium]